MSQILQDFQNKIRESSNVAIFWHDNPDGDAIGSMLGLGALLERMEKKVSYFAYPKISKIFSFLSPHINKISTEFDYSDSYDLLIFVDFSDYPRTNFSAWRIDYFESKSIIVIDHHLGDTPSHALVLKDEEVDSNCEWIFELTKDMWSDYYDSQVADFLYMGIVTDTGNFSYDKQWSRSLANAASLVDLGANKQFLTKKLFGSLRWEQLQFISAMLAKLQQQGTIGYLYYTREDYESFDLDKDEAGEFLLYLLTKLSWIDFFLLVRWDDNCLKISFRSNTPHMSAEKVARFWWWWGHFYAAGAKVDLETSENPLNKMKEIVDSVSSLAS